MLTHLPSVMEKMVLVEIDLRGNRMQDLSPIDSIQTLKKVPIFSFF